MRWLPALLLAGPGLAAGDDAVRCFSIHDTLSAAAAQAAAEAHIVAGRWGEAIEALQVLIEQHRGEVLGEAWDGTADDRQTKDDSLYHGAPRAAAARLASLSRATRDLYRQRFGPAAR